MAPVDPFVIYLATAAGIVAIVIVIVTLVNKFRSPQGTGAPVNEGYSKAIDEMKKRIKDGKPLRKSKINSSGSESDILTPINRMNPDTELAKVFKRVRKASTDEVLADQTLSPAPEENKNL